MDSDADSDADQGQMEASALPSNTLPVTVATISNGGNPSSVQLFCIVAGNCLDDIGYSHSNWALSRKVDEDDALHKQIKMCCQDELKKYPNMDGERLELFKRSTPGFIVTEVFPSKDETPVCVTPHVEVIDGRTAYRYTHSDNAEVYVRIFEPASPSDIEFNSPDGPTTRTKLVSLLEPVNNLEYLNRFRFRVNIIILLVWYGCVQSDELKQYC